MHGRARGDERFVGTERWSKEGFAGAPQRRSGGRTRERGRLVTLAQKPGEAKFGDKLAQLKSLVSASADKSTAHAEEEQQEDDFFTTVVPDCRAPETPTVSTVSRPPDARMPAGLAAEDGAGDQGHGSGEKGEKTGVVTESIWSNMWAGGVRASVDLARASYSQGKISAEDLKRFVAHPTTGAGEAPPSARPPSLVPGEMRALEFKLAKLTKKLAKARARGEGVMESMYEKEVARLRGQILLLGGRGGEGGGEQAVDEAVTTGAERDKGPATTVGAEEVRGGGLAGAGKCGVGLKVEMRQEGHGVGRAQHVIAGILPGSAAAESSLLVGDVITQVSLQSECGGACTRAHTGTRTRRWTGWQRRTYLAKGSPACC